MATNTTPPIPQDEIKESFVWRDWFQRLSNRVYGTMSEQDASAVNVTGGVIQATSVTTDTLYVPTGTDGQVLIGKTSDHSFTPATLTAGTNITITNAPGSITIAAGAGSGDVVGPASATDNAVARFDTTTGKLIQNSVVTVNDTGDVAGLLSEQFSDGTATTLAAGKMWYNGTTGSLNFGMGGGNITQQVGEELFIYGKASSAITDSPLQIVYHTGTVGASGVITFAPTIIGITNVNDIIGVATESLALNDFGRVTAFGVVRGITTNGTAFGQTWADDDVIWYDPVTGNPTNVEPVAPNIKVQIGTVINAGSSGSGSFQVLLRPGSVLGGTDSNVQFSSLANNNLIAYDSTLLYWKNVTPGSVTGVGSVANSLTSGTGISFSSGTTYNGSAAITINNSLPMVYPGSGIPNSTGTAWGTSYSTTGTGTVVALATSPSFTTPLLGTPTSGVLTTCTGYTYANLAGTIPTWNQNTTGSAATLTTPRAIYGNNFDGSAALTQVIASTYGGTGNGFTKFSGATTSEKTYSLPDATTTILTTNTAVTAGQGGTGQTTYTVGDILYASATGTLSKLTAGTINYVLTSGGAGVAPSWAASSGSGATISNDTATATNVYPLFAAATSGSLATAYTSNAKLLYKPSTGEFTSSILTAGNGIVVNSKTVATSYTIATGYSGMSAGPITIASGQTVTISSGSKWVVL